MYKFYIKIKNLVDYSVELFSPYFRRAIRFLALPYCYFMLIDWNECKTSYFQVMKDLLYIFFVLKYFPDNYGACRLWEIEKSQWPYYYGSIYNPYQRARLRKQVQKKEYEIIFLNKYICYELCKAANLPLPEQYGQISSDLEFKKKIKKILDEYHNKNLIIKPITGRGGKNILLAYKKKDRIVIQDRNSEKELNKYFFCGESVIQEFIEQHKSISKFALSINTLRVITLLSQSGEVLIVGAYMRFGLNNAFIDNVSSGGISVGINIGRGELKKTAFDKNGKKYIIHPTTKCIFKNFKIPYWLETLKLCTKIQKNFFYYKLLGHDIAIKPDGPIIIEINEAPDTVALEQRYGPILKNKKVRNEFEKYNLLINNKSKSIT